MSTLVDTSILTGSARPGHPTHVPATEAVDRLTRQGEQLCLVPQNLYEFWVVATRPIGQNGLGLSASETAAKVARYKQVFIVYDDVPAILPAWENLVTSYGVLGKNAHDARLVAAMAVHGIGRILTFNSRDFQRYAGITVVTPDDILQANP
jgi:predicted nucleic acid-binding protein